MTLPGGLILPDNELAEICRRYQVKEIAVFGSAARGELQPHSDVDFLVTFLPKAEVGLLSITGLMLDLSKLIGRKVDVLEPEALKPQVRETAIADARVVYAA